LKTCYCPFYFILLIFSAVLVPIDGWGHIVMPVSSLLALLRALFAQHLALPILAASAVGVISVATRRRWAEARGILWLGLSASAASSVLEFAAQQPEVWFLARNLGIQGDFGGFFLTWFNDLDAVRACGI
jgi:hypothetical protein